MKAKSYKYIYRITCLIGDYAGCKYIGQHSTTNMDDGYAGSGVKIQEYYSIHGCVEGVTYKKDILKYANTQRQLDKYEIYYINKYKNKYGPKCLNMDDGGLYHENNNEPHFYTLQDKCISTEQLVAKLGLHKNIKSIQNTLFICKDTTYVLSQLNLL